MTNWNIEEMTGYKPQTTFWTDFSIAERFGMRAVKETFERAFEEWKSNTIYITELAMVLNWKCWQYAERNVPLSDFYCRLWEKTDTWCCENLKGDDLRYYYTTTD